MISVKRLPKPSVLHKNEVQWRRAITDAQKSGKPDLLKKATNKYQHAEIKAVLRKMFHGKCAYCESKISHIDYGHIEHFKPKGRFPRLAVSWSNLLLSCAVCNGREFKGDVFPSPRDGGPLINPCKENPDVFFEFEFDERVESANILGKSVRGTTSVTLLGLNREQLRQYRSRRVRELIALARYYHSDKEARELLDEAAADSGEYAAFARMVKANYVEKAQSDS